MVRTCRMSLLGLLTLALVSACQLSEALPTNTSPAAATPLSNTISPTAFVPSPTPEDGLPDQESTARLVQKLVDEEQRGTAIVIGFISADPPQRWVVAYGQISTTDSRPPNGDTVSELGSITKTFTGLLLAEAVQRGEMNLDDPISLYLPEGVSAPEFNGMPITLLDLATHTSGLPRMADNFVPADRQNPFVDYTLDRMFDFLTRYKLTRAPGSVFEYSNYGAALEGIAILQVTGENDYETLLVKHVTEPLGMPDTRIQLTADMLQRLAQGHNSVLYPVNNWDLGISAPAGGIRSTANDMLTYLAANLGIQASNLLPAMQLAHQPRRPADMGAGEQIGLNWFIRPSPKGEVLFHGGATGGYSAFVGFNPALKIGVVVLSNAHLGGVDVQDVGFHLLDPSIPLQTHQPRRLPTPQEVDPLVLGNYVGVYKVDDLTDVIITLAEGQLYYQFGDSNSPKLEMLPLSPSDFTLREADVILSFMTDPTGKTSRILWTEEGVSLTFNRSDE